MSREIPKTYDSQKVEDEIYRKWEASGFFNPDRLSGDDDPQTDSFTISMPPPNATGVLHLGHASMLAYQDLMIRFARLRGKRALWLPGTDHASIATQTKVEKNLKAEGKTKHSLGRERFLARVDEYVRGSQDTIRGQIRKMGSSCDWSRERYTLDEGLSVAVRKVFEKMYADELIYRGERVVNWCPRCESTIADDEVEHVTGEATLYYFKYDRNFPITIATTRPETKLGDTGVAVNPKDERYQEFIGQTFEVDFFGVKRKIKVIADWHVDMAFGTGALGVTPAHSAVDFKMGRENGLSLFKVIGEDGKMTEEAGSQFAGLTTLEARLKVVELLRVANLMQKEETSPQNLSVCYRCGTGIEPLPSLQWFVDVDKKITLPGNPYFQESSLKEAMLQVVRDGEVRFIPSRFEKIYFDWIENLSDWCISRQIWFGHPVPVSYCDYCDEVAVGKTHPEKCPRCAGSAWRADEDTLDTWFSSGLWTFSTLLDEKLAEENISLQEWLKGSADFQKFHPTEVMETGRDLIFFWVARMILMTLYVTGQIPFKNVYLHGMIVDAEGRKMSKSLGNGIDPLEMIGKYGTDAVRLAVIIGATPGNDLKIHEEKFVHYRNFVNKLWNIARFIFTSVEEVKRISSKPHTQTLADAWILGELNGLIERSTQGLGEQKFSQVGEDLYDFTWNKLADWFLEAAKAEGNKDEILLYVLERLLILLHPFAPFVTEELWKNFETEKLLMVEKWPQMASNDEGDAVANFALLQEIVSGIRNLRSEHKVEPAKHVAVILLLEDKAMAQENAELIKVLARLESLSFEKTIQGNERKFASRLITGGQIFLPLEGLIDTAKEKANLEKEKLNLEKRIESARGKLASDAFVNKAPEPVVRKERERMAEFQSQLKILEEKMQNLS